MKVTIVGGGPVGALAACMLGQEGHNVDLFDFRPDPCSPEGRLLRGRSINMALSSRGRATLARAGLEKTILASAVPMRGRMLHSQNGTIKSVLYDPVRSQCIYSVSRRYLNEVLLKEAASMPNVNVNFNCKLLDADLDRGSARFRRHDSSPGEFDKEADLVIGADGAHSAMRQCLLKRPMTNFGQKYIEHGYIELYIPATGNGGYAMEKNYLHIWPRDRFMLIALPNLDGSFTVTLFMPFEIFSSLNTMEKVLNFFHFQFPDVLPLIGKENLVQDFLTTRPSTLISISCYPLHAGRAVLVGDAAHAMVPFYGQGMNAGFEDLLVLDEILADGRGRDEDVRKSLERFTLARSADAQAICELAMYNYEEMRHLVNQKSFYLRRIVDLSLYRVLGNVWTPLYNSVTFSSIPYAKCIANKKWQDEVIAKALRNFVLVVILSIFMFFLFAHGRDPRNEMDEKITGVF